MRDLVRDKQTIYYALYDGVQELTDDDGNYTGEYAPSYAEPVKLKINVSAAKGTADVEEFGIDTPYTKTLTTHDMSCPIAEDTILWIGKSTSDPHNYVVTRVARSVNTIKYAVKEVDLSESD